MRRTVGEDGLFHLVPNTLGGKAFAERAKSVHSRFGVGFNGDDCYKVEDQGVLCITPMKTHQQVAAPGYSMCYVWMIRHLPNDPWIKTRIDDLDHKWLLDL